MKPVARGNISSDAVFETLDVLSRTPQPLGVADLHRFTGEPTSSVHRAISTLEEAGFAARHQGSNRYMPGPMCSHLVRAVLARFALARSARPYLARLVEVSGGAGTLNARLGWYAVRLLSLDDRAEYAEARLVGQPRFLHEDLSPLTILAFMPEPEQEAYRAFASRESGLLAAELDIPGKVREVRRGGHALKPDDGRPGRAWAGFPLFHPEDGRVFASLAVSVALDPASGGLAPALARELEATTAQLQRDIASDPRKCATPYRGIDPDDIRLNV